VSGAAESLLDGVTLNPGKAEGAAFLLREPLSFWGGFDPASGRIVDRWHPLHDEILTGRILIMKAGRGSSSGSSVLAEAIRLRTAPSGIILLSRDPIITVGAMIASELYGIRCPVVLAGLEDWPKLETADRVSMEADGSSARIALRAG
jgi:uncharacterized protein